MSRKKLTTHNTVRYNTPDMNYLTLKQAGDVIGVSAEAIRKMIANGVIKAQKHNDRWMISPKALTTKRVMNRRGKGRPRKQQYLRRKAI